jgi:ABC-type sulfate transport system permease subunit
LDRPVVDVNWKIAHGIIYTASRLINSFGMVNIDVLCHCRDDEESLEHLWNTYARILVG